jgi:putative RecB family exonuclease
VTLTSFGPSRLSTYGNCPKAFSFAYIEGLPNPPSLEAVRGTIVHSALQGLYSDHGQGARTREAAQNELDAAYQTHTLGADYLGLRFPPGDEEDFYYQCLWLTHNYFEMEDPDEITPVGLELFLSMPYNGTILRGIIDRLDMLPDGSLRIVDYKTGKAPAKKYRADKISQLLIYCLLVEEVIGQRPRSVRLLYLRDNVTIDHEVTDAAIASIRLKLEMGWTDVRRAEEADDFPPKPGPLCDWCNFQPICPAWLEVDE